MMKKNDTMTSKTSIYLSLGISSLKLTAKRFDPFFGVIFHAKFSWAQIFCLKFYCLLVLHYSVRTNIQKPHTVSDLNTCRQKRKKSNANVEIISFDWLRRIPIQKNIHFLFKRYIECKDSDLVSVQLSDVGNGTKIWSTVIKSSTVLYNSEYEMHFNFTK